MDRKNKKKRKKIKNKINSSMMINNIKKRKDFMLLIFQKRLNYGYNFQKLIKVKGKKK